MDGRRQTQLPGMRHYSPYLGSGSATHHHVAVTVDPSEEKLSVQVAEIERLSADRRSLALAHVALKQELAAAHQEIEKYRGRIKDTTIGSDIEINVLRDKIAKLAAEIKARDTVKNELQREQMVVIDLLADKRELNVRVQKGTEELEKVHFGLKSLSQKHKELHDLKQEHQRLRTTFEYERAMNVEKIGQMQAMKKNLQDMSREVETLCDAILTAEKNASLSYADPHTQPQPVHTNGVYVDIYGRPYTQMVAATSAAGTVPYGRGNNS